MTASTFTPLLARIPPIWQPVIALVFIVVILLIALLPLALTVLATRMLANVRKNDSHPVNVQSLPLQNTVRPQDENNSPRVELLLDSVSRQLLSLQNTVQAQDEKLAIQAVSRWFDL